MRLPKLKEFMDFRRFVGAMLKRQNDIIVEADEYGMMGDFRVEMREMLEKYCEPDNPLAKAFYENWDRS